MVSVLRRVRHRGRAQLASLCLARNVGMDPSGSPYITHYSSLHFLFYSFSPPKGNTKNKEAGNAWPMDCMIPSAISEACSPP